MILEEEVRVKGEVRWEGRGEVEEEVRLEGRGVVGGEG